MSIVKPRQLLSILITAFTCGALAQPEKRVVVPVSSGSEIVTALIQECIDRAADADGGIVKFKPGIYRTGTLVLRDGVTLQLSRGTLIQGSDQYSDYQHDALIFGEDLHHIAIEGEGTIDGVDCRNPKGEEGFRGPHCIRLVNCSDIRFQEFTILNSANWALNCRYCSGGVVDRVKIFGGHDGLHTRFCSDFRVSDCDFRTGDDAFAGNDNRNMEVVDCLINTSCNGFRMGCQNLVVKRCKFWGPGEYKHQSQDRTNMLTAFVHFSPDDENPELVSNNWIIEDISVENVDHFYMYNHRAGLWQTGRPAEGIRFNRIEAKGLKKAFSILGIPGSLFSVEVTNSMFKQRQGVQPPQVFEGAELPSSAFFNAHQFDRIVLSGNRFIGHSGNPVLEIREGNTLLVDGLEIQTEQEDRPYLFQEIGSSSVKGIKPVLPAIDFEEWFTDGVMRLDLIFSGSADETTYALEGIRKEEFYSGSRTHLIDPFDYGDHLLRVRDSKTGALLYSYTYCTLFREWQTTAEAGRMQRAFPHVIRFPWPKEEVTVEILDRDRDGDFHISWTQEVNPGSFYADPGNPLKFETVDVEIHGSPDKKVDLLFIAEGYTRDEMDKFLEDVERSADYIFSEEPFKSNRRAFNIRAVKSCSEDSGTDIPGEAIWKNTVVNSSFYTFGIERYMTTLDHKSVCDVASNAHYDQIYILVNTDKYGGGGIYNFYSISAADNEASRAVVIHEFGHSFGGLADEYFNSAVAYSDFFNLEAEPWNPNLTTLVEFDSKWSAMVGENVPVPTPPEGKFSETVGVYEGGGYVARGVFRPMIDCRMHTNDAEFCPVCQKALKHMIMRYTEK